MVEYESRSVFEKAKLAPKESVEFINWVNSSCAEHPAGNHPLYQYLQDQADINQLALFVFQETTVDGQFDDVIAQAQIGAEYQSKLEFFRNFADEMGNGNPEMVHTKMFKNLKEYLNINFFKEEDFLPESLLCGNLASILSLYRGYYNF